MSYAPRIEDTDVFKDDEDDTTVLNPVDVETEIRKCRRRIHNGVRVVTRAHRASKKARRDYDRAVALAYMRHDRPAHEKKYAAEIATHADREAAEDAEITFRHAERTAKALEDELRALQSLGASVRSMYSAETGVGR